MALTADNVRLKAVNHVTYNVRDKVGALKFWKDVLGVKEIPKQVDSEPVSYTHLTLPTNREV